MRRLPPFRQHNSLNRVRRAGPRVNSWGHGTMPAQPVWRVRLHE